MSLDVVGKTLRQSRLPSSFSVAADMINDEVGSGASTIGLPSSAASGGVGGLSNLVARGAGES